MAAEVVQPPMMPNDRLFEECSGLVTHTRGDPDNILNRLGFVHGSSALGLVERQPTWCDDENAYYRHTANFALVLKEAPEMMSRIFSFDRCTRRWQVVANFITGREAIRDEIEIHLLCLDAQNGSSIRADIRTDLYRGTERIADVTPTNVYFGAMSRHVIITGAWNRTPADDTVNPDRFVPALYTLLGSLCFKNCCDDQSSSEEEPFDTDFNTRLL